MTTVLIEQHRVSLHHDRQGQFILILYCQPGAPVGEGIKLFFAGHAQGIFHALAGFQVVGFAFGIDSRLFPEV